MTTALKTLLFTLVVPGTVAGLLPYLVHRLAPGAAMSLGVLKYAGYPVLALGILIYLWCAWDFTFAGRGTPAPLDPPKQLVVRGLYRFTRNPMYVGVGSSIVGQALLRQSWALLVYAVCVLTVFHLAIVLYEEPTLRRTFGAAFEDYCRRAPRWIMMRRKPPE